MSGRGRSGSGNKPGSSNAGRTQGHGRQLASVGNASSLFGGGNGGQDEPESGDFFNGFGGAFGDNSGAPHPPTSPFGNSYSSTGSQGIGTVLEEDEPLSPDLGRGPNAGVTLPAARGGFEQQHQQQHRSQHEHSNQVRDAGGNSYQNQYQYDQQYDQQFPQSQHQPYQQSQSHQEDYSYSAADDDGGGGGSSDYFDQQHEQTDQHYSEDYNQTYGEQHQNYDPQQEQEAFEPPYYPGYIYDAASNSYLPDPNAHITAAEGWSSDQQSVGYQVNDTQTGDGQGEWNGYGDHDGNLTGHESADQHQPNYDSFAGQADDSFEEKYSNQQGYDQSQGDVGKNVEAPYNGGGGQYNADGADHGRHSQQQHHSYPSEGARNHAAQPQDYYGQQYDTTGATNSQGDWGQHQYDHSSQPPQHQQLYSPSQASNASLSSNRSAQGSMGQQTYGHEQAPSNRDDQQHASLPPSSSYRSPKQSSAEIAAHSSAYGQGTSSAYRSPKESHPELAYQSFNAAMPSQPQQYSQQQRDPAYNNPPSVQRNQEIPAGGGYQPPQNFASPPLSVSSPPLLHQEPSLLSRQSQPKQQQQHHVPTQLAPSPRYAADSYSGPSSPPAPSSQTVAGLPSNATEPPPRSGQVPYQQGAHVSAPPPKSAALKMPPRSTAAFQARTSAASPPPGSKAPSAAPPRAKTPVAAPPRSKTPVTPAAPPVKGPAPSMPTGYLPNASVPLPPRSSSVASSSHSHVSGGSIPPPPRGAGGAMGPPPRSGLAQSQQAPATASYDPMVQPRKPRGMSRSSQQNAFQHTGRQGEFGSPASSVASSSRRERDREDSTVKVFTPVQPSFTGHQGQPEYYGSNNEHGYQQQARDSASYDSYSSDQGGNFKANLEGQHGYNQGYGFGSEHVPQYDHSKPAHASSDADHGVTSDQNRDDYGAEDVDVTQDTQEAFRGTWDSNPSHTQSADMERLADSLAHTSVQDGVYSGEEGYGDDAHSGFHHENHNHQDANYSNPAFYNQQSDHQHHSEAGYSRDGAQSPHSPHMPVPDLKFEAPSPEIIPQEGDDTTIENFSSEELDSTVAHDQRDWHGNSGHGSQDYNSSQQQGRGSGDNAPVVAPAAGETDWGFDDSQVFGDEDLSHSTSGSNYGEWNGESDAQQGYDYVLGYNGASSTELPSTQNTWQPTATWDGNNFDSHPAAESHIASTAEYDNYDHSHTVRQPPPRVNARTPEPSSSGYIPQSPVHLQSKQSPKKRPAPVFNSPVKATSHYSSQGNDHFGGYATTSPRKGSGNASSANRQAPEGDNRSNLPGSGQSQYASYQDSASMLTNYGTVAPARRFSSDDAQASYANHPPAFVQSPRESTFEGAIADLHLEKRTAPVITFGFGGRMVVVFPVEPRPTYGMDTSPYGAPPLGNEMSPSSPATVHIRKLVNVLPVTETASFPGPVFMDGGKANAGKKRKEAVTWLDQRIEELTNAVSFVQPRTGYTLQEAKQQAETDRRLSCRLILVRLVKVLVENEGKLNGSPKIDEAVRSILVPTNVDTETDTGGNLPIASELSSTKASNRSEDGPFVTYAVYPSNLDRLSAFLLRGERREAVKYALDHQLWGHALVISSCVDTDCWNEAVQEFLRSELSTAGTAIGTSNGREGLRVAYSVFAGLSGSDSIKNFLPTKALAPQPLATHRTLPANPLSANMGPLGSPEVSHSAADVPDNILEKWQETAAMIVANRTSGDSAVLTALGDTLTANGWYDAGHICYLLSPATSPIGGANLPNIRLVLLGAPTPGPLAQSNVDLESIALTELVEFAFSLTPIIKGQEAFAGFPHLQAYKLYHAGHVADAGHVSQAQRYTEALASTFKLATKPSPFYNPKIIAGVKTLSDRLTLAVGHDKTSGWLAKKVQRPTIDSLWSTFEGGFTKFVAGEGEQPSAKALAARAEVAKTANGAIGPFSHYSSISPGSTSGTLSRAHSNTDLHGLTGPPSRPVSAAAKPAFQPILSPGPPPVSRPNFKGHHARSSSLGFAGYDFNPTAPPPWQSYVPPGSGAKPTFEHDATPRASAREFVDEHEFGDEPLDDEDVEVSGWEKGELNNSTSTLRAPTFAPVGDSFKEDDSGFISPMGAYTPSISPAPNTGYAQQRQQQSHRRTTTQDELDDLGIGNSRSRKPGFAPIGEGEEEETGSAQADSKKAEKPKVEEKPSMKTSRSWLGGWFKREGSPAQIGPGPVKANLGEQTSFVYDAELKRWVNKKTGASSEALATAPPPRAATASPSRASRAHMQRSNETPPPMPEGPPRGGTAPPLSRARTSADLNELHRSGANATRTNSAGPAPPTSRPSSAADSGAPPALSSRPSSAAGTARRKPIAKRYVAIK